MAFSIASPLTVPFQHGVVAVQLVLEMPAFVIESLIGSLRAPIRCYRC